MNKQTSNTAAKPPAGATPIESSLQALVDHGAETLDTLKATVSEITEEARSRGARLADRAAELVKDRPLTSLAVAFGVGYITMRIMTSKLTQIAMVGGLLYVVGGQLLRD